MLNYIAAVGAGGRGQRPAAGEGRASGGDHDRRQRGVADPDRSQRSYRDHHRAHRGGRRQLGAVPDHLRLRGPHGRREPGRCALRGHAAAPADRRHDVHLRPAGRAGRRVRAAGHHAQDDLVLRDERGLRLDRRGAAGPLEPARACCSRRSCSASCAPAPARCRSRRASRWSWSTCSRRRSCSSWSRTWPSGDARHAGRRARTCRRHDAGPTGRPPFVNEAGRPTDGLPHTTSRSWVSSSSSSATWSMCCPPSRPSSCGRPRPSPSPRSGRAVRALGRRQHRHRGR